MRAGAAGYAEERVSGYIEYCAIVLKVRTTPLLDNAERGLSDLGAVTP
jgi:hypothetical protein